jgi:hypothetical protein
LQCGSGLQPVAFLQAYVGYKQKYTCHPILMRRFLVDKLKGYSLGFGGSSLFIDQKSPHQYWMARVFLLIADISLQKGDRLQARATLQSLNDYYEIDNDGILDEVKAKLATLRE